MLRFVRPLAAAALLTACGKPASPPPPPTPGPSAVATRPAPPAPPAFAATRVRVPVASRSLRQHLDALDAQSPFREEKHPGYLLMGFDDEKTFSWGADGEYWPAMLDLCARGRLRIDSVWDSVWLGQGRPKMHGVQAIGPALASIREVKAVEGKTTFQIYVSFERGKSIDAPDKAPEVKLGGRVLKAEGSVSGQNGWGWTYTVPEKSAGPLETVFELDRPTAFADVVVELKDGAEAATPDGKGKIKVEKAVAEKVDSFDGTKKDGFVMKWKASGLEPKKTFITRPDGTEATPFMTSSFGMGTSRTVEATWNEAPAAGARLVIQVITATEKIRVPYRVETLDWARWSRDIQSIQGRIAWPKAPAGKTEVSAGVLRPDGTSDTSCSRGFDLPALAAGGDAASAERWASIDGTLWLGVLDEDKFPTFRAELLDDGDWIAWVRVGNWVDAHAFTVSPDGARHDVPVDPERSASVGGKAPAGSTLKFRPATKDGKPWNLPRQALGPLFAVPVAADGSYRLDGLKPGTYVIEGKGPPITSQLKAGQNTVDVP